MGSREEEEEEEEEGRSYEEGWGVRPKEMEQRKVGGGGGDLDGMWGKKQDGTEGGGWGSDSAREDERMMGPELQKVK